MKPHNDKLLKSETKSFFFHSPISKYSNITLFNRREKEFSNINSKTRKVITTKFENHRHKKKLFDKKIKTNTNFQTDPSIISIDIRNISNIFPLIDYYNNFLINKKIIKQKTKNNTFITSNKNKNDVAYSTHSNSFFSKSINKSNNDNKTKTLANFYKKKKIPSDIEKYGNSLDTYLLNTFETEKKIINSKSRVEEYKSKSNKNNSLLEAKNRYLYKEKKQSHNGFINKTLKLKLIEYATNIKKERAIRLQETNENNVEYFQDEINSLEEAQKLFNSKFLNKMADYTRFVSSKKEIEKVKLSKTIQQIFRLKTDIEHISAKIKKVESEKNNIIRWIYFQIQITEKKLVLPNYYKSIIEETYKQKMFRRSSRKEEKDFKDNKKDISILLLKRESKRRDSRKYGLSDNFSSNRSSMNTSNSNLNSTNKTTRDEIDRIRKYKTNLAIKNADELQEKLGFYANDNIILMEKNDVLNNQLFYLNKKLNNIIKTKNSMENLNKSQIIIKEKELDEIKSIYKNKKRVIAGLQEQSNEIDNDKKIILYRTVKKIYSLCKVIEKNEARRNIIKKANNWREEILNMLEYIEISVDNLLNKFKNYSNDNAEMVELIKKLSYNIDKKHKNDKAIKQKMQELKKSKELREKFEERNNRIIFLSRRKFDISKFQLKKKKDIKNKNVNKIPGFEDYLFHEDDEDNNKNDK